MEEDLITLETAKLAEKKGFNEITLHFYRETGKLDYSVATDKPNSKLVRNNYSAPSQSLLHKWLREVHYLTVRVQRDYDGWSYIVEEFKSGNKVVKGGSAEMPSYELEFDKGLKEALKLIKEKVAS
jgi:hypothetical protein